MRVLGETVNAAYLTGLGGVGFSHIPKCYLLLHDFCRQNDVRHTHTTILKDNLAVQRMLEKPRKLAVPAHIRHSTFRARVLKKRPRVGDENILTEAGPADLGMLAERSRLHFAPLVADHDDFYLLKDRRGAPLACGKVWRQRDYKQYVGKRCGWKLRLLKLFWRALPPENEAPRWFTLSFVVARDEAALAGLLRHVSRLGGPEGFFFYGRDGDAVCPASHVGYQSFAHLLDWEKKGLDPRLKDVRLSLERGLL
ncbi:MAG: hypothetical protein LBO05_13945 [Deltaproteobacteria bacterium]|jgi:hypothetical protein|nr:hypothetical protein [Deltaproteobacteria bacterium]